MQNFVFCEWELYDGTAPEQKTKSTKNPENSMFSGFLHLIHRKRSPFPSKGKALISFMVLVRLCAFSTVSRAISYEIALSFYLSD